MSVMTPRHAARSRSIHIGGLDSATDAQNDSEDDQRFLDSPHESPVITDLEQARQIALRRLTVRARSAAELKQDLCRRHVAEDVADQIVTRFLAVGLLDDEDFARQWVTQRRASKSLSTARLHHELREKGVDASVISRVLDDVQDSEFEVALKLARAKVRTQSGRDRAAMTRRLAGQLERRGFSASVVRRAVIQVVDEAMADGMRISD